jgi:signal transduction histidine kinase
LWLGSGLGLLIARLPSERMGGDLLLESRPGHGPTATILLRPASETRPKEEAICCKSKPHE